MYQTITGGFHKLWGTVSLNHPFEENCSVFFLLKTIQLFKGSSIYENPQHEFFILQGIPGVALEFIAQRLVERIQGGACHDNTQALQGKTTWHPSMDAGKKTPDAVENYEYKILEMCYIEVSRIVPTRTIYDYH